VRGPIHISPLTIAIFVRRADGVSEEKFTCIDGRQLKEAELGGKAKSFYDIREIMVISAPVAAHTSPMADRTLGGVMVGLDQTLLTNFCYGWLVIPVLISPTPALVLSVRCCITQVDMVFRPSEKEGRNLSSTAPIAHALERGFNAALEPRLQQTKAWGGPS
jgi:hypothetical protein